MPRAGSRSTPTARSSDAPAKPIAEIFAADGEPAFRAVEERVTLELLDGTHADGPRFVALGGGALGSAALRRALRGHLVIWIDVDVNTAWRRCADSGRPLAVDRAAFERLHAEREPVYARAADVVVPQRLRVEPEGGAGRAGGDAGRGADAVGDERLRRLPGVHRAWAAADRFRPAGPGVLARDDQRPAIPGLRRPLGAPVRRPDHAAGRPHRRSCPGEQSKTIAHAEIVWSELVRAGMTRSDVVVALGGGRRRRPGGFCAATYQRGVRFVQVPTTVVAQVDSAYGGKTGVDLSEAKNYVGVYHQPAGGDLRYRRRWSRCRRRSWRPGTPRWSRRHCWPAAGSGSRSARRRATDAEVICACAHTKLRVVAADERDSGLRQTLNLGHTVGHAIETVTGYASYRHGEAVGLGLLAALRLSGADELRDEVADLLERRRAPDRDGRRRPRRGRGRDRSRQEAGGRGPGPVRAAVGARRCPHRVHGRAAGADHGRPRARPLAFCRCPTFAIGSRSCTAPTSTSSAVVTPVTTER